MKFHTTILAIVVTIFVGCSPKATTNRVQQKSRSMEPTIAASDCVRWVPLEGDERLGRGDLVIIRSPTGIGYWARRIIGMPGERIEMKTKGVVIDGSIKEWDSIIPGLKLDVLDKEGVCSIPPGTYFCVGDNLNNSRDSREFGPVNSSDIIGIIVSIEKAEQNTR